MTKRTRAKVDPVEQLLAEAKALAVTPAEQKYLSNAYRYAREKRLTNLRLGRGEECGTLFIEGDAPPVGKEARAGGTVTVDKRPEFTRSELLVENDAFRRRLMAGQVDAQFSAPLASAKPNGNGKKKSEEKIKVKTYSDRNRPRWKFVVNYHIRENGERRRARKFFETRKDADEFARQKNIELENTGKDGAEFSPKLREMARECGERLEQYGKTIADATAFLVAHLEASKKSCTAQELVDKLIAAKTADGASKRYTEDLSSRLNRFAEKFDGQKVATITGAQIDDWLRGLPVSPVSRNNYRRVLVVMFNYAIQRGYATSNPAESTAKAKVVGEAPGILTLNETARLLEAASTDMLPYLAIGAFAGLRRAELERLDWSDVHFDNDLIEVTAAKAKTARRRFVKMQPNLREWLLPLRKHRGRVAPDDFRNEFDAAREAAKITEWPDNALRHSFASYHLAHFKDSAALALEMGHTDSDMIFNHYRQLVRPNDAERYWNIRPAATGNIVAMVASDRKAYLRRARIVKAEPLRR